MIVGKEWDGEPRVPRKRTRRQEVAGDGGPSAAHIRLPSGLGLENTRGELAKVP